MAAPAGRKAARIVCLLNKRDNLKIGVGHTDELMWGTSANRCAPHRFINLGSMLPMKKEELNMGDW